MNLADWGVGEMLYSTLTSFVKIFKERKLVMRLVLTFAQVGSIGFRYFRFVYCDFRHCSYHPGDPARMALGPRASVEVVERLSKQMYLDRPLPEQYILWLGNVFQGDFGDSLLTRRPVLQDIREFFPATLELVVFTSLFIATLGITLGVLSAMYANTWFDNVVRIISYLGIVTPAFAWAVIFILIFGFTEYFSDLRSPEQSMIPPPWVTGMMTVDSLLAFRPDAFGMR
jgi:peptide/nickel transport system permease protein